MSNILHPYKGYLNTTFSVYNDGPSKEAFTIQKNIDSSIVKSIEILPHVCFKISFSEPGKYKLLRNHELIQEFTVEDGYKFGGSKYKRAFIFDGTPWAVIVMHDRTYFHNRNTGREYMEVISPDEVEYVSASYVILSNKGNSLQTLYALDEEQPAIVFENLIFKNEECVIWREQNDEEDYLCMVKLADVDNIQRIECEHYLLSGANKIYNYFKGRVTEISLQKEFVKRDIHFDGKFLTFIEGAYLVSQAKETELTVASLENSYVRTVPLTSTLAKINGDVFLDVNKQIGKMKEFSKEKAPECTINANYVSLELFPSANMLTFVEKTTTICIRNGRFSQSEDSHICNATGERLYPIKNYYRILKHDSLVCLSSGNELFVVSSVYGRCLRYGGIYKEYETPNGIYAQGECTLSYINKNGYLNDMPEVVVSEADFSLFEKFGVIKERNTGDVYRIAHTRVEKIGRYRYVNNQNNTLSLDKGILTTDSTFAQECSPFKVHSETGLYGVEIHEDAVSIYTKKDVDSEPTKENYTAREILRDVFDASSYRNVLLSEDGCHILSRSNSESLLLDVKTGHVEEYDNATSISHINGIRPYFRINNCRQIRLINPLSGTEIDIDKISQYNFVSPNGTYYADTRLEEYVEFYNLIEDRKISKDEYLRIRQRFSYGIDKEEKARVVNERKAFVEKNLEFLIERSKWKERSKDDFIKGFVDEKDIWGVGWFVGLFIEKRGVAVIRRTDDDSVVFRIQLGLPLWFLNYVAFSQDENYVAIAGRYPNDTGLGGLLLVYDLKNNKEIYKETESYAVWTASFSKKGNLAAYTSTPLTFWSNEPFAEVNEIRGFSFLTFSPDGDFFALSQQGYIAWNNGKNANWGHQPSCLVSIRSMGDPNEELACFEDLSDCGIEGLARKQNVASVSFSNNNESVMMVGADGVIIIRRLNLTQKFPPLCQF